MLQIKDIRKQYKTGDYIQNALDGVSLELRDNEFVAILGPSGSGKTTLLNIIGGLDRYDSGDLIINGISTKKYKDRDWDAYRNHTIGFVFQSYNLIPHQSVLSNVELALTLSGISRKERRKRAKDALEKVGLGNHLHKKPNQMSGGQMQRVAIARALVNNPEIILADEPTGALDSETSVQIMELLKEVAQDRLVVMVTHNPELAEEYANRIVRVKDGQIVADTNPVTPSELEVTSVKPKRTRLGFLTALGLSLNNLMTKKGRTFLTSFAGAIGIIGIALILALSNGVNAYIASIESDMMGTYPIELEKQTFDMSSMMAQGGPGAGGEKESHDLDAVYSNNIVADSMKTSESMMTSNDLGKFKLYLDANMDTMSSDIAAIEYGYEMTPQVFRLDDVTEEDEDAESDSTDDENVEESDTEADENEDEDEEADTQVIQVSPASLETSGFSFSGSTSSAWSQLVTDQKLRENQYELLAGEWPSSHDEVALIITGDNEVSDYTLYTLGLMDMNRMNELLEAVENGEEYEDPQEQFAYSEVLGLEYKVFAPCELYALSEDDEGIWIDKSENDEYIASIMESGLTVKITCVLRATDDADISSGVAYDAKLTEYLIDVTINSEIVRQQLENPTVNVFTGEEFEVEEDDDEENEEANIETSTSLASASDTLQLLGVSYSTSGVNTETPGEGGSDDTTAGGSGDTTEGGEIINEYKVKFVNYDGAILVAETPYQTGTAITSLPTENPVRGDTATSKYFFIGWESSTTGAIYRTAYLPKVTEDVTYTAFYYEYVLPVEDSSTENVPGTGENAGTTPGTGENAGTIPGTGENAGTEITPGTGENPGTETIPGTEENPGTETIPGTGENAGTGTTPGMGDITGGGVTDGSVTGNVNNGGSGLGNIDMSGLGGATGNVDMSGLGNVDTGTITGSMSTNLSDDQLDVLMAQRSDSTPSTYEDVLSALGYCTVEQPTTIAIYPENFEGKTAIEELIEEYNNQVENEADKVTYTDMVGTMTSAITSIVDTISYVLIAFVAISLVVSSIMIAIITYISVLERTKEIGVLRALGAAKNDVSKIFNAETFIEGLLSGCLGVGTTLLICIPVNSIVYNLMGVENIAQLPMQYSIILIMISIILTTVAGFAPSRVAAKKDPVTALRTE